MLGKSGGGDGTFFHLLNIIAIPHSIGLSWSQWRRKGMPGMQTTVARALAALGFTLGTIILMRLLLFWVPQGIAFQQADV